MNFSILCVIVFVLDYATGSIIKRNENRSDASDAVCTTPGCHRAVKIIKYNLDESIDPCVDFFKFACGGFINKTRIPNDKSRISYFDIIADKLIEQLRTILEEPPVSDDPPPFNYLKTLYSLCIDVDSIESNGLNSVKSIIQELGGWPVLEGDNWKEDGFDWKEFTYKSRKLGLPFDSLIRVVVNLNPMDPSQVVLELEQASLGLDREYLIDGHQNKLVKAYGEYLVDMAVAFGAERASAKSEIAKAFNFEIELAKIELSKSDRRDMASMTNLMTIAELNKKFPSINWVDFLNNVIDDPNNKVHLTNLTNVAVPDYLQKLEGLLRTTPNRVQANYLIYQVLLDMVPYLTRQLRDRKLLFSHLEDGVLEHKPRWQECTILASLKLQFASGALYVRRYFSQDAKKTAEGLVTNLKSTFISMLKQVEWMDINTKNAALEKAAAMGSYVGYPQELMENDKLQDFYSGLNVSTDNFMEFVLTMNRFAQDVEFLELLRPFNRSDWTHKSFVASVDAFYNPLENSLQLPAGILQSPFFDTDRPNYMNYGYIGFAIGHEITHGFDDIGRQFDKDGSTKEWWEEPTKQAFNRKAQCIIDQYGSYRPPGVNKTLNGEVTLGENIADNGGVKESYLAYGEWVKKNGEEPRLPNIKYSQRQLFWISTANLWCTAMKREAMEQQVLTNVHSPPNYRVVGALSNSQFFALDFNCPLGSKMNPVDKCQVW